MDSITLPEETALKVKQLEVKCENLEDQVELLDSFFTQLDGNQEENRCNLEKLEKRVSELEVELEKTELLEERVSVLNIQNIELRNHLNLMIDTLNNVVKILNSQVEEPTDEATTPDEENPDGELIYSKQDMDEDTQPTLSQVYTMYQSQPPDEEGWDEMTAVIKAAEEYEAGRKSKQMTVITVES